jgi:hypothetical protein
LVAKEAAKDEQAEEGVGEDATAVNEESMESNANGDSMDSASEDDAEESAGGSSDDDSGSDDDNEPLPREWPRSKVQLIVDKVCCSHTYTHTHAPEPPTDN